MRFDVLTLFPGIFDGYLQQSLLKLAIERGLVDIRLWNIRDYSVDKHQKVDDRPFGGGPGMLMCCQPVFDCVEAVLADGRPPDSPLCETEEPGLLVMLSPQGRRLDHSLVTELATHERLLLLCGRYEGFRRSHSSGTQAARSFGRRLRDERWRSAGHAGDRHGHPAHPGCFGRRDEQQVRFVRRFGPVGAPPIHPAAHVSGDGGAARSSLTAITRRSHVGGPSRVYGERAKCGAISSNLQPGQAPPGGES